VSALGAFQAGVQRTTAFHARYVVTFSRFVTALWRITARVERFGASLRGLKTGNPCIMFSLNMV